MMEILHNFKAICFIPKTKEKIKEDPHQAHKQGIWIALQHSCIFIHKF